MRCRRSEDARVTTTPGRGVLDLPAALVHEREWDDVSCESVEQICLLHVPDPCSLALPDEVEDCSKRR